MKACGASGGIAASTRTSTRSNRHGCRCCSRSTASSALPTGSSTTRTAKSCARTAVAPHIAVAISPAPRSTAVPTASAMPAATAAGMAAMEVMAAVTGVVVIEALAAKGKVAAAAGDAAAEAEIRLRQPHLVQILNAPVIPKAADALLQPPRLALARDRKQIISRCRIMPMRQRRGRGDADRRDFCLRTLEPHRRMNVVMAVQDQVHAVLAEQCTQCHRIRQPLDT